MTIAAGRKGGIGPSQIVPKPTQRHSAFSRIVSKQGDRPNDRQWPLLGRRSCTRASTGGGIRVDCFSCAFRSFRVCIRLPLRKVVARVPQGIRRLSLTDNAYHGPAFAEFPAKIGEVRIAGHEAERVHHFIEQQFQCVQCERNVASVLPAGVLVLQAWCECLSDQRFRPTAASKRSIIAIAAPHNHAAELRDETQCMIKNRRWDVVTVDQYGDPVFPMFSRISHRFAPNDATTSDCTACPGRESRQPTPTRSSPAACR